MPRATRYRLAAVGAIALVAAVVGATRGDAASSGVPGTWTVVGVGGTERPVGVIGAVRVQGTLHVAWVRRTGGNSYDLMHTAISPGGAVGSPTPVVSGWAGLGDAALVSSGGQLLAFFPGSRTTNTTEPFFGLNLATSANAGASWSLYGGGSIFTDEFAYGRTPSVALVGGTPIETWNGRSGQVVHVGLDPRTPAPVYGPSQCCNLLQNIATDGTSVWVAWCSQNDAPPGRWVQAIDPTTGRPTGSATKLVGSEGPLCEAAGREPLVVRAGGGFYVADASGGANGTKVSLWKIGSASPLTVTSSSDAHSRVALAADPNGRLWVAWRTFHGASVIHLRRSNRSATRFGAEVRVNAPKSAVEVAHIDLDAQADRVDVLASFSYADSSQNTLYHTQAWPGLTLAARGGKVVSFVVTDAGDPVAGATIKVGGRTLRTNASGRASADLPRGRFRAVASKRGYVGAAARVSSR
jgi:hypothetical protein